MYAAREITKDDSEPPGKHQEEETLSEQEETERHLEREEKDPYEGSQYSSEGKEVDWEECQSQDSEREEDCSVRMYALTTALDTMNRYAMLIEDKIDDFEDWDVEDPYGEDMETYRRICDDIEARVADLAARIRAQKI